MSEFRPRRRSFARPAVAGALLLSTLLGAEASSRDTASPRDTHASFLMPGMLTGGPVAGRGQAVQRPYFVTFSYEATPRRGLLTQRREPGGVVTDPRTGWVYVATRQGRVICLAEGEERWSVDAGGEFLAPPEVFEESLVVGNDEGVVFVFNKVTGELRTRALLGEELITQPVVVRLEDGPPIAYFGSSADSLFAVDIDLGERLWRAHRDPPAGFTIRGFARPVLGEGILFLGFADGFIEARDPISGLVQWERRVSPPGDQIDVDALAWDEGVLYAASYSGGVYALSPANGETLWRTPLPGAARLKTAAGRIFAVSPGEVVGLRPERGDIAWRFRFDDLRIGTDPVVLAGLLVIAQEEGALYFLDARTGAPEGIFTTGAGFSSPPAGTGAALYALSNGGRLYGMGLAP